MGECAVEPEEIWKFVSPERKELDMIITFDVVNLGVDWSKGYGKYATKEITIKDIRAVIKSWIDNQKDG